VAGNGASSGAWLRTLDRVFKLRGRRTPAGTASIAPVVNQVQFSPYEYRKDALARVVRTGSFSRLTARSDAVATSAAKQLHGSRSASGARRPRCCSAGASSAAFRWSRSRRTATGSRRTRRSSTSHCPTRTWRNLTRSTAPAALSVLSNASGGEARSFLIAQFVRPPAASRISGESKSESAAVWTKSFCMTITTSAMRAGRCIRLCRADTPGFDHAAHGPQSRSAREGIASGSRARSGRWIPPAKCGAREATPLWRERVTFSPSKATDNTGLQGLFAMARS
jgi:hypothetical protein